MKSKPNKGIDIREAWVKRDADGPHGIPRAHAELADAMVLDLKHGEGWVNEAKTVPDINNSRDAETCPHPFALEKPRRVGGHGQRQLDDGIAEFFVLHPLLAQ